MGHNATMNDLEKYLKGEPLTAELAALKNGDDEHRQPQMRDFRDFPNLVEMIDDDDREHLRRLTLEPGWAVLLKLLDTDIRKAEDAMKDASLDRPLSNPSELASGWADVAKMKAIRLRMVRIIDAEVRKLDIKEQR